MNLPTSDSPTVVRNSVASIWSTVLAELRETVTEHTDLARSWLLTNLGAVKRDPSMMIDQLSLSFQVVYACLLASRRPLNPFEPDLPVEADWSKRLLLLSLVLVAAADINRSFHPEVFEACTMRNGDIEMSTNDLGRMACEINLFNIREFADDMANAADLTDMGGRVRDVEVAWFGASVDEVIGVLLDAITGEPNVLSTLTRVTMKNDLMLVDLRLSKETNWFIKVIRQGFVLNPQFWRSRAVPSFYFADLRAAERTDEQLIETAAAVDWFRYSPLLCGAYAEGSDIHVVGVTTYGLLWRALQRSRGSLSSRLYLVDKSVRAEPNPKAKEIAASVREVHVDFEESIVRYCESVRMIAEHSVDRIDSAASVWRD
jgi:hypothetical protein